MSIEELQEIRILYDLKNVDRACPQGSRKESTAEHVYSTLILFQYIKEKIYLSFDEMKVIKLILYHDLVEIYAGDVSLFDKAKRVKKQEFELQAIEKLKKTIPKNMGEEAYNLFFEFENMKTTESLIANCLDKLDPMLHQLNNTSFYKNNGITEKVIRTKKEPILNQIPELKKIMDEIITYWNKNKQLPEK